MQMLLIAGIVIAVMLVAVFLPAAIILWWRPAVRVASTNIEASEVYRRRRIAIALVILPTFCFMLSFATRLPLPDWQSGHISDYCFVAINARSSGFLLPLILYAVVSALYLLRDPNRHAASTWVLIGIAGGAVLTLQFAFVYLAMAMPAAGHFVLHPNMRDIWKLVPGASLFVVTGIMLAWAVISRRRWLLRLAAVVGTAFVTLAMSLWISHNLPSTLGETVLVGGRCALAMVLIFAPFWCLAIFVYLLHLLLRRTQMPVWNRNVLTGAGIWSTAYMVSLYRAVAAGIALYESLPTHPPSCFIATAAAGGHCCFVRSWPLFHNGRLAGYVNRQLLTLKCFELLIQAMSPEFHRIFRWCYNRVGYPLSRLIVHAFIADIVYVLLKPPEWAACLALRLLVPGFQRLTTTLSPCRQFDKLMKEDCSSDKAAGRLLASKAQSYRDGGIST